MSGSNDVDPTLLEFARQVAAIPRRISEEDDSALAQSPLQHAPTAELPSVAAAPTPPHPIKPPDSVVLARQPTPSLELRGNNNKKLRTPDELANLILTALQELNDYPGQGFLITVYGSNPWSSMLTIRPEAGPRIDRPLWLARVREMTAQLRNEFDVVDETHPS